VGVIVAVGVAVAVGEGVIVGVALAVAVGEGVAVGVGVAVGGGANGLRSPPSHPAARPAASSSNTLSTIPRDRFILIESPFRLLRIG